MSDDVEVFNRLQKESESNPQYKIAMEIFLKKALVLERTVPSWSKIFPTLMRMGYFQAPASTKYHLSIPGGLFIHSVGVTVMMERFAVNTSFRNVEDWKIYLTGLLHDIGKCGFFDGDTLHPRYELHGIKYPWDYTYVSAPLELGLVDLSAFYAVKWNLPWDVVQAIRTHDGPYVPENKGYEHKMCPLSMLAMVADTWVGQVEENRSHSKVFDGMLTSSEACKLAVGDK